MVPRVGDISVLFALGQGDEGDDEGEGEEVGRAVRVIVVVYVSASASASFEEGVAVGDGFESEFVSCGAAEDTVSGSAQSIALEQQIPSLLATAD
jgi:hypothetical protein